MRLWRSKKSNVLTPTTESMLHKSVGGDGSDYDLSVPIYLDTKALLDLLASIEKGFNTVETITSHFTNSKTTALSGRAGIGVSEILSNLLKLDLGGSAERTKNEGSMEERHTTRYYTFGSLLYRLRAGLRRDGLIKQVKDIALWETLNASDFVEIRGKFVSKPLNIVLQSIDRVIGLVLLSDNLHLTTGTQSQKPKKDSSNLQEMRKFFQGIMKDLEHEGMETYVVNLTEPPDHKIVISLFTDYLRDRSGTELLSGEFLVFGKVARTVKGQDSINLLEGSVLSRMSEKVLSEFIDGLRKIHESGLLIPDLITRVEAPTLQLIPIAICI